MVSAQIPDRDDLPRDEKNDLPLVSVIMSVRNCQETLPAALHSIFDQTYSNWHLVVCDDASTDGTLTVLKEELERIDSSKYTLLENAENRRLAYSLNRCLDVAKGDYIARMDGDDVSQADRFERQVEYLTDHPEIDLVGTAMRRFNDGGPGEVIRPATLEPDKWTLGRSTRTPFAHATILARRHVFDVVGKYTVSPRTARAEDLDLWYKFYAAGLTGRNLPEPLYWVREDASAIRRRTPKTRLDGVIIRLQGNRKLRYPIRAYLPAAMEFIKVFIPYFIFDWHRSRSRTRGLSE